MPKARKIKLNPKAEWEQIIKDVEKNEVPITVLQCIVVNLLDGTIVELKIKEMLDSGQPASEIQENLDAQFDELSDYIVDVDFYIDTERLADTIQPMTDRLLKRLK